jgi:hypothetical protein
MDARLSELQRQHRIENTLSSYLQLMVALVRSGEGEPDGREYLQYLYEDLCAIAPIVGAADLSYLSYPSSLIGTISQIHSYDGYPIVLRLSPDSSVDLGGEAVFIFEGVPIIELSLQIAVFAGPLTGDPQKDLFARTSIDHNRWLSSHLRVLRSADETPNRIMSNFIFNRWPSEYALHNLEIPYISGSDLLNDIIETDIPKVEKFLAKTS